MPFCPQCAAVYELPSHFCAHCGSSLGGADGGADEQEDRWLGRLVDKRYRVQSRIGAGGMGLVYKVEHVQLGKVAAMKVLHADTAEDGEVVRRFRLEAQAISRLNHPNIVQTFDFGQWEGALYLVMEYVRGDDLATIVKREGPLPFARAAPLFVQICSALTDAHEAGVIHRDLKPENIVVLRRRDGSEHAKVLDFGLAKLREREGGPDAADITSGGQVIGTPYYMSPEQVRSEPLDVRTDVYSLGATLYRVLTGTPPFQAATPMGVLTKHITDDLEPPRVRAPKLGLPPEADVFVSRAMAKTRDQRYASAAEAQHALEEAIVALRLRGGPAAQVATAVTARVGRDAAAGAAPRARPVDEAEAAVTATQRDQAPARAEAAARDVSEPGDGGDRLRRQEFDAFEQSLRRRRLVAWLAVPAFVSVAIGIGAWAVGRSRPKASTIEREPNNAAVAATLLPLRSPVEGRVGKRGGTKGGEDEPDMDYFQVPAGRGQRVVSARLEGVPGVDLVMEIYDAQGRALAKSDAGGPGAGEWLQPVSIGPGEAYLLVRQVWIQGTPLLEDVETPYRLTVDWRPPYPGWEVEPNDTLEQATRAEVTASTRGYLSAADDRDWFVFTPAASGRLLGRVTPPAGVEVTATAAELSGARIPRRKAGAAGAGRGAAKDDKDSDIDVDVEAGRPVLVGVARALPSHVEKDPKAAGLHGLDDPNELKLELRARAP